MSYNNYSFMKNLRKMKANSTFKTRKKRKRINFNSNKIIEISNKTRDHIPELYPR